jgi:hypothetical protein
VAQAKIISDYLLHHVTVTITVTVFTNTTSKDGESRKRERSKRVGIENEKRRL